MENEPIKAVDNRQPDGKFGPGNNANPAGRPKGKTLKEYQAEQFRNMTDKEKAEWLTEHKVPAELRWRMSEGNPSTNMEHTGEIGINVLRLDV